MRNVIFIAVILLLMLLIFYLVYCDQSYSGASHHGLYTTYPIQEPLNNQDLNNQNHIKESISHNFTLQEPDVQPPQQQPQPQPQPQQQQPQPQQQQQQQPQQQMVRHQTAISFTTALPAIRHIIRRVAELQPRLVIIGAHRRHVHHHLPANVPTVNDPAQNADSAADKRTVDEKFQQLKEHAQVDKQNVHESTIRKIITQKLLHLISVNKDYVEEAKAVGIPDYLECKTLQSIHEIRKIARSTTLQGGALSANDLSKVDLILKKISSGFPIVMKNDVPYREDFIMNQIWDRVNSDNNVANRYSLQRAFIDNLLDCIREKTPDENPHEDIINIINALTGEEVSTYCINGRVARLMSTFTHLDADPVLAKPIVDADEASNEAYDTACFIYKKQMEAMSPELKEIYDGDRDNLTKEQEDQIEKFDRDLKKLIEQTLRKDYEHLLEPPQLEKVISRAVSVVI